MSKSGGIAYLLKHGRAPFPVTTRTQQPRAKGVKRMADGGLTNANAPLNYGTVPDYVFVPGGMEVDPVTGKPVWKSGRYEIRRAAATPAATGATGSVGVPSGGGGGGGGGGRDNGSYGEGGGGRQTDYGSVIGDPDASGKTWGELTPAQQAAYSAIADPYGIGNIIASGVQNSLLGKAATAIGGWLDRALGRDGGDGSGQGNANATGFVGDSSLGADGKTGEAEAAANLSNPDVQAAISNQAPTITDSMRAAAEREGRTADGPEKDGGYTGGSYANGDFGYTGPDRGDLFAGGGFVPRMAAGGIGSLADHGGFVGSYAAGGRMLRGPGDGLSDGIPAVIGNNQPARLADGEFVVSADVVSALGGGSTKAGAKKLYDMMARIRQNAHGTKKQVKKVNERKVLPA